MKVLIVEDDRKIKTEVIDDELATLGCTSDWATNQQDANKLLAAGEYDLALLDLQIPSRPGGRPSIEYGKNTLKQIHASKGQGVVPVILMTGYHQDCVDLLTELQEIGVDGSISKPFPTKGRTLAVVIEEVREKARRRRRVPASEKPKVPEPFAGGILAFHPRHIELCGEIIVEKNQKGYAWRILHMLREKNDRGRFVRMKSTTLAEELHPNLAQNTLSQSIRALRRTMTEVMRERLDVDCGPFDVIDNRTKGYHLKEWIVVEVHEEAAAGIGGATAAGSGDTPGNEPSERQRWILAQLAAGEKLTRRQVEEQFGISARTAKRELSELVDAGKVEFDDTANPGHYRRKG